MDGGLFVLRGGDTMIATPMDVLRVFPVRKTKKQKQAFRDAVQSYARNLGYQTAIEQGKWGCRNIILGDPETAAYLVTAHYDTPASPRVPNVMVPCNPVLFILSQLLIAFGVFLPAIVVTVLAAYLTGDPAVWYPVMIVVTVLSLALMVAGPANRHNANDNTSGVVTLLETAASMPENLRDRVCFVLFDLEELGMVGSSLHRKKHKFASDRQTVLNLDCVGDGDTIMFLPGKAVKKDEGSIRRLIDLERRCGEKRVVVRDKGFSVFLSDQFVFPRGVGICALRKNMLCYYAGRIHTFRGTLLEYTNVNILRACLITYISGAGE